MAAIQRDTSTCLASEQTAIRKEKSQMPHLPPASKLFLVFFRQLPPSATVFPPSVLSLWFQPIIRALWCIIGAIRRTHITCSQALWLDGRGYPVLSLPLSLPLSLLSLYCTNCFPLRGLASITFVGVMGLANYSRSATAGWAWWPPGTTEQTCWFYITWPPQRTGRGALRRERRCKHPSAVILCVSVCGREKTLDNLHIWSPVTDLSVFSR